MAIPWSVRDGSDLRAKRLALHLTQSELASRVGKSAAYVSELELGKHGPSPECAELLDRVFENGPGDGHRTTVPHGASGRPPWSLEDGRWLRMERRKRGLTQAEVGSVIGRTGARIAEFERARHSRGPTGPSYDQLRSIKDFFARTAATDDPGAPNGAKARFTVEIDNDLMSEALAVSGAPTKTRVIDEALREFVRSRRIEQLRKMIGTDAIDLTPEDLRKMRGK